MNFWLKIYLVDRLDDASFLNFLIMMFAGYFSLDYQIFFSVQF